MTPAEFIKTIGPAATSYYQKTGIRASITIAQAALETGWGKSVPTGSNNYFGIKWGGSGAYVLATTQEFYSGGMHTVQAKFAKYSSIEESISAHSSLLLGSRYTAVRQATSAKEAAQQLQRCGYATDPQYAQKLISIIEQYGLTKYDIKSDGWPHDYFKDVPDSDKAAREINVCGAKKLLTGYCDGTFRPDEPFYCDRRELASRLYKAYMLGKQS